MSNQITSKPNFPANSVNQGSATRLIPTTRTKPSDFRILLSLLLITIVLNASVCVPARVRNVPDRCGEARHIKA
jgi:hypothetical protein